MLTLIVKIVPEKTERLYHKNEKTTEKIAVGHSLCHGVLWERCCCESGGCGYCADKATEVYTELCKYFPVDFDDAGSIGKRYRREDEIGTPICITYDFDSLEDNCVTVRDRDTMEQKRIPIADLKAYIEKAIEF